MAATRDGSIGAPANHREEPPVRVMLRPVGSPLPLGFFAFGIGSFTFTTLELGWIATTQIHSLALILLGFVVPLQLIACIVAYWARDAGVATALGLFGMTWAAVGLVSLNVPAPTSPALGILLLCLAAVMITMGVITAFGKPVFSAVMVLAFGRFLSTGIYELGQGKAWEHASGWLGIPLSICSLYLATALLMEDVQHRTVLPLFRRGIARLSVESELGDQVAAIEHEAGVRDQL
jgi:succinate-acetate transporter protein